MAGEFKVKNPWYIKPLNLLYKHFGIVVMKIDETAEYKWSVSIFKVKRGK